MSESRIMIEQSIIGSLLYGEGRNVAETSGLEVEDFSDKLYAACFKAIKQLSSDGMKSDIISVYHAVGRNMTDISGALQAMVSYKHLGHHCRQLREIRLEERRAEVSARAAERIKNLETVEDVSRWAITEIDKATQRYGDNSTRTNALARGLDKLSVGLENATPNTDLVLTGFSPWDRMTGGMLPGDYSVVAARPSVGKTAITLQLLVGAVCSSVRSCLFSLEMTGEQVSERLAGVVSRCNSERLIRNPAGVTETTRREILSRMDTMYAISDMLIVHDRGGQTLESISRLARQEVAMGCRLIAVDYLQLLSTSAHSRNDQVGEISRWFKDLLKELRVPGIMLSQFSRDVEKRGGRPRMSDLRESGAIEQDADTIWFLHRPNSNEPENIELILEKNRFGRTGFTNCRFARDHQTFYEVEDRHQ